MQRSVDRVDRATHSLNRTMASLRGREFRVLALSALRAQDSVERLRGTMVAVSALVGGFGAAFTIKGLMDYSDTYKEVGNRLRVAKNEAEDLASVEEQIFRIAQRSRSQYEATGVLFARLSTASRRLMISQGEVLRVTETIQKAMLVGGATPVEAAQSSIQLSQGIASNKLQGDELRSVLENPALGQLLANEISGGNLGMLREMAAEGELTAGVVVRAFSRASAEIDRMFATTQQTIGQAFVVLDNAIMRYVGRSDEINSASRASVTVLNALAENIETVGDAVGYLAAAFFGIIGARGIGGATSALVNSTRAMAANRTATRQLAAETLESTQAFQKQAIQQKQNAIAAYEMAKANTVTASTRKRLGRELQAAYALEARAINAATQAQIAHQAALQATTVRAMAASAAVKGFSASIAFLGGPLGATLLAAGALWMYFSARASEAAEASDRYADAIQNAGNEAAGAAPKIREAAAAMAANLKGELVDLQVQINQAEADIATFEERMRSLGLAYSRTGLLQMAKDFEAGRISIEDLRNSINQMTAQRPDLASTFQEFLKGAENIEAARGKIDGIKQAIENLDGKTAEVNVKVNVLPVDIVEKVAGDLREQTIEELKRLIEEGKGVTDLQYRMYPELEGTKEKKTKVSDEEKAARKFDKEVSRDLERYIDGLEKLQTQIQEVGLDELDQKVIENARSFDLAEAQIRQYIEAVRSGGDIPAQFQAIRNALSELEGYERMAAIADGAANAFGDLFTNIISGGQSAGEALGNLAKTLADLFLQIMVIEPLVRSLRSAFTGGFSFFGGGGGSVDAWAGLRAVTAHSGWTVGKGSAPGSRMVGADTFVGAPRFHDGVRNNEIAAILEKDETVLTRDQSAKVASALSSAVSGRASSAAPSVNIKVDARYAQKGVAEEIETRLRKFVGQEMYGLQVENHRRALAQRAIR